MPPKGESFPGISVFLKNNFGVNTRNTRKDFTKHCNFQPFRFRVRRQIPGIYPEATPVYPETPASSQRFTRKIEANFPGIFPGKTPHSAALSPIPRNTR